MGRPTGLEVLVPGVLVTGLVPAGVVRIITAEWCGTQAVRITFEDLHGTVRERMVYRDGAGDVRGVPPPPPFSLEADGGLLRLATEAHRISLAHQFDPYLALHTSLVRPLPHQITAVYDRMLPCQPLRFLLADDPGAGKTIMAGLLIRELMVRGDVARCLIIAPGGLVEQWQDELAEKFALSFDLLTRDLAADAGAGNPFDTHNRLIARLDGLSRNAALQDRLFRAAEWDLIIVDEAHRMSAQCFGAEVKRTKRYQLGERLGQHTRHLLLMSATPHNGKEAEFQLFMALLDADRFGGGGGAGPPVAVPGDMMRRLTKEELVNFDGTPLFPERRAYTVHYKLSEHEAALYAAVTTYVREEMNRVQRFAADGRTRANVGFALQILQRRLASSPAAIYNSLRRRRERIEAALNAARTGGQGALAAPDNTLFPEDADDEWEEQEGLDQAVSGATCAKSIAQLGMELETLKQLEKQARAVLTSGRDTKWAQLDKIFDEALMHGADGTRRKLIIFTEARDTLAYLHRKIVDRLGTAQAAAVIHGGISRGDRRAIINRFMQDKTLVVLIANDAAGEGVNLQRGHLMVNYDLPWNPNRIEQRFGRIHRIGQTEVCHLWNLVAANTREGQVYGRLLDKLDTARGALQGRVYDVLGEMFQDTPLRDLLWQAIQYGDQADVKANLFRQIDGAVDQTRLEQLLHKRKLTQDALFGADATDIRLRMERAAAARLQPHHIQGFFLEAFARFGGTIKPREAGRWEITHIPLRLREWTRATPPVPKRYERICFDKALINRQPVAEFICPGHPLLDVVVDMVCAQYGHLPRQGAVLVDESDHGTQVRAIVLLDHSITDRASDTDNDTGTGAVRVISRRLEFAAVTGAEQVAGAGMAPHLDVRPATASERAMAGAALAQPWLSWDRLKERVTDFATGGPARAHLEEVRARRLPQIEQIEREVNTRLRTGINYWDGRAAELKQQEQAGRSTRLNWRNAQRRAEMLEGRLHTRLRQCRAEQEMTSAWPEILGGFVVIPRGLLKGLQRAESGDTGQAPVAFAQDAAARQRVEVCAMQAVMQAERDLGHRPRDVSAQKCGYDILSFDPAAGTQRFIEVKGRVAGARSIDVTRNEIITCLHAPDRYILAIVEVADGVAQEPRYVRRPFAVELDFRVTSQRFELPPLLAGAGPPG
ncbi:MAG: DUF3883 domain-containing protein [Rhodobacteraceae bacterium]|nr:DUF3883 domain-containing protein [Paracoccaceae bacterium]